MNNHASSELQDQFSSTVNPTLRGKGGLRTKGYFKKSFPEKPLVSTITVVFNGQKYIEQTILSILKQSYDNIEYIVIDGGSTDGTVEIIRKYEHAIDYWISEKDDGQADALNKGFRKATGDIVGWQNADDIYMLDAFRAAIEIFNKNPNADFVFGNTFLIDANNKITGELRFTPFSYLTHFYEGMSISNQSCFWKRSVFDKIGYLDTKYNFSMDYEFFLRAIDRKLQFKRTGIFFGGFRLHSDAKTSTIFKTTIENHKIIDTLYKKNFRFEGILRLMSFLRRIFFYIIQGDLKYIFNGIIKQLSGRRIWPPL